MTKIQWTDLTQNPIKRDDGGNYCELVSPGCANCYASLLNSKGTRFGGNGLAYGGSNQATPEMVLNVDMIQKWARMRKPKRHFVGSMTDLFGEWVPDWIIYQLFDAMAAAPQQTFQLLTKRPERMYRSVELRRIANGFSGYLPRNIWLGTSAENQKYFDERSPWLVCIKAQVRFLSLEPLLGPINLSDLVGIDWVIVGGESGPNARPLDGDWILDILEQCKAANIPAFVKQLGSNWAKRTGASDNKGGDPDEWPGSLGAGVRMFPGEVWE